MWGERGYQPVAEFFIMSNLLIKCKKIWGKNEAKNRLASMEFGDRSGLSACMLFTSSGLLINVEI